ncbi:MAG: multicopper oxidase family protein [Pseudomonadota bacterium]
MAHTRRDFLIGSTAATFAPSAIAARHNQADLIAAPADVQLVSGDHGHTKLWTYNGLAPGPMIRAKRGDRISQRLVNNLPQETTIHWHGIRIDNAMDGVPGISQQPVQPGDDFLYDFAANDAGTYWYHPHVRSWEQVARGLHGPLIIEEDIPPEVDREETLVLDDWRLDAEAQIDESFGLMHDWSHAGRIGNFVTVNGDPAHKLSVGRHERIRLRLINSANARVFTLGLKGLEGWVVALDGQPLSQPEAMDRIRLAPAQRADLIVDVTGDALGEAFLISFERDGDYALTTLDVDTAVRPKRLAPPAPLQANDVPALGTVADAATATLVMAGGAMGGMRSAMIGGVETDIRELVRKGRAWAFNGVAEPPADPLLSVRLGETARISLKNDTRWPHAMHLHGHHFHRMGPDGEVGPLRDTLLLDPGASADISFVADNPGAWLFHCHMLEHSAAGMSTWIDVA